MRRKPRILLPIVFFISCVITTSCLKSHQSPSTEPQAQQVVTPKEWKKIELENFSFSIPADMEKIDVQEIDSAIWEYNNNNIRLVVDFGRYSNDLQLYLRQPDYHEEFFVIAGKKAKIASFRLDDSFTTPVDRDYRFIAAAHFPKLDDSPRRLTFSASCKSPDAQEIAKTIFHSIEFKGSLK
jgi:hypothetical protein